MAIETSWSGHLDVLAVFFLAVSFLQVLKKHYFFSGIFLGLSAMSKLVPLLLSIFFMKEILLQYQWRIQKPEKQTFLSVGVFGIGLILPFFLYIPHLWAEGYLISSLAVYSRQWVFGSFFYSLLGLTGMDGFWIRIISGLNLFFAAAIIILRRRDLKTNLFFFMISLSLFSPVVHPWYLLWLIPFAGEKYFYTAVVFLLASYLSYEVLEGMFANHVWQEKPLIIIAGYAAALFVLVFETYGKNIRRLLAGSQDDPAT
ncbi:MAG: hypothetical protein OEZ34_01515 [Spirochaetia bacterium]|nr:hypothetical protein [Spirochaetia bacterium]